MSRSSVALACAYFAVVLGLTVASELGAFPASVLASSPMRAGQGRLWLLLSNALLAQRPVVLSLFALAVLMFATLAVCGARLSLLVAGVGHVGSTLLAYALVGAAYLLDDGAVHRLLAAPDYGVSAIQAAWVGAVAAAAWRRGDQTRRGRAVIVAACLGVGLCAWLVRSDLTLVDADHVFAFTIGASLSASLRQRVWAPTPRLIGRRLRRALAGARLRLPVRVAE